MAKINKTRLGRIEKNFIKISKNPFLILAIISITGLSLSLILEKVLFDFGKNNDEISLRKETIEDRNVSVSVCFDLCDIIKTEFKK